METEVRGWRGTVNVSRYDTSMCPNVWVLLPNLRNPNLEFKLYVEGKKSV